MDLSNVKGRPRPFGFGLLGKEVTLDRLARMFTLTPPLSRPGRGKDLVDETKKPIPFLEMGSQHISRPYVHPLYG
jgi:hypothetical protein